jgi:propionyl-CoA carboxylase beta chain
VYSPALTDFVIMVEGTSHMFITGPDVVKAVTGESVTQEELGGAQTHAQKSGVAHVVCANEKELFSTIRTLLEFLPSNEVKNIKSSATKQRKDDIFTLMKLDRHGIYDVRDVIDVVCDTGEFFEISAAFAPNIVCGFSRVEGNVVGVVANQPSVYSGALDIDACEKAARFVRTCDAFDIPLVTLVDVAGFLPGVDQERSGIIRVCRSHCSHDSSCDTPSVWWCVCCHGFKIPRS